MVSSSCVMHKTDAHQANMIVCIGHGPCIAVPAVHCELGTALGFCLLGVSVSNELCRQATVSRPCCAHPTSARPSRAGQASRPQNARHRPSPAAAPAAGSAALSASSAPSAKSCCKPANGAAERCGDQCNARPVLSRGVHTKCLAKPLTKLLNDSKR